MKMIWVHLVLLLQATSVFCQIRQSTFQVSSVLSEAADEDDFVEHVV